MPATVVSRAANTNRKLSLSQRLKDPLRRCKQGWGFPGGAVVKNLPASAGEETDVGSVPGQGRSPGGGNGNALQHSCLENSMDRGVWRAAVHGATKSRTRLSD